MAAGADDQILTVLGPGANIFHYNHIHVDLALHGNTSAGPRRICRPLFWPSTTSVPPRDGLPNPPELDEEEQGKLMKKAKELAPKYRTELLPP